MFVQKYKTCRRKSKKKKLKSYPNKKTLELRKLLIPFSRFFLPEKKFPKKSPPFPNFHKFPGNRRKQVVSNTVISRSLIKCPSPGNERMPATAQFSSRACTLAFRADKGDSLSARVRALSVSVSGMDACDVMINAAEFYRGRDFSYRGDHDRAESIKLFAPRDPRVWSPKSIDVTIRHTRGIFFFLFRSFSPYSFSFFFYEKKWYLSARWINRLTRFIFFFFFWSKEKEKLAWGTMSDGRREVELKEKKETVTWNHWIICSMIHAIL